MTVARIEHSDGFTEPASTTAVINHDHKSVKSVRERSQDLSGLYRKIWTAQGTNQNAPFHLGPVQP